MELVRDQKFTPWQVNQIFIRIPGEHISEALDIVSAKLPEIRILKKIGLKTNEAISARLSQCDISTLAHTIDEMAAPYASVGSPKKARR